MAWGSITEWIRHYITHLQWQSLTLKFSFLEHLRDIFLLWSPSVDIWSWQGCQQKEKSSMLTSERERKSDKKTHRKTIKKERRCDPLSTIVLGCQAFFFAFSSLLMGCCEGLSLIPGKFSGWQTSHNGAVIGATIDWGNAWKINYGIVTVTTRVRHFRTSFAQPDGNQKRFLCSGQPLVRVFGGCQQNFSIERFFFLRHFDVFCWLAWHHPTRNVEKQFHLDGKLPVP